MAHNSQTQSTQTSGQKSMKAIWNLQSIHIFCDVCIAAVEKKLRPSTHFSSQGWKFVVENFHECSGLKYDKVQLKNKWDLLKTEWKLWKELKGAETELGWDARLETLDAPSDWWVSKIKANKNFAKFRRKGIHPDIESKNDIMFGNIVANGDDCYKIMLNDPFEQTNGQDENHVPLEGSGDSRNVASTSQPNVNKIGVKRKYVCGSTGRIREDISRLIATVESRSNLDYKRTDPPGFSIREIMADLHTLPDVPIGSELYYFATLMFEKKIKRIIWKNLATPEAKVGWLKYQQRMFDKNTKI